MSRAALLAVGLLGCAASSAPRGDGSGSGGPSDARAAAPPVIDAAPAKVIGARDGYRLAPTVAPLEVRVEWASAPPTMRARSGVTACGTPRAPRVQVHTLGGVAGVLVVVDIDAGRALDAATPTPDVVITGCAIGPRLLVVPQVPAEVVVRSTDLRRHAVTLRELGAPTGVGLAALAPGDAATPVVGLPWAGAAVQRALAGPTVLRAALVGDDTDAAWVVATGTPYAGVTDETGVVQLGDAPAGTFAVTAWLPPAAGQAARLARGMVTVAAGAPATVTLHLDEAP